MFKFVFIKMKLAFGYKMRSGKDTSVDYLVSKYGGKRMSFAKALYDALFSVQNIFGLPKEKDRKFLVTVGDWAREKDPDIFVNIALKDKEAIYCSDVRFLNEFRALKSHGWKCIKINRDTGYNSSHSSECELDSMEDSQWDYIIDNNGTLEDLYNKLDNIIIENSKN